MTRWLAVLLLMTITAGCASWPIRDPALLVAQADRQAREGAWEEAVRSYDEYLARFPDGGSAARVRESRETLVALLTARAEQRRQREEVARLRDEVARLRDEGTRLDESGSGLHAETTVLRVEVAMLRDEVVWLREERTRLHEELTRRKGDLARTRQELAAQQAEAERLRADIESLKELDLKQERKR